MSVMPFRSAPRLEPSASGTAPLTAVLRFGVDDFRALMVTVDDGTESFVLEYGPDRDPTVGLPVVGMKAGRRYEIRVTARVAGADGSPQEIEWPHALEWTTPPLPDDPAVFPPIEVCTSEPDRMEPGITLVFARRRIPGEPIELTPEQREFMMSYGLVIALDPAGEVIWYYQTDARVADAIQLRNGNFLFLTAAYVATEVDVLGNVIQQWYAAERPQGPHPDAIPISGAQTIHHCIYELSNGNLVAFTAQAREVPDYYTSEWDPDAPRQTTMVMGDEIIEFTRDGEIVWRWDCFDHLDPYRIGYETLYTYWWVRGFPGHADWSHGNSMWIDEDENTILLCLRYQEAIYKIDRTTGDIMWILGEDTDWSDELRAKLLRPVGDVQWPYHMHTPSITTDGTLLVFDNGVFGARPFTPPKRPADTFGRAVEYRIDEENGTVEQVWASNRYGEAGNLVAYAMGDADHMPRSGNILISYGMAVDPGEVEDLSGREYNRCSHVRPQTRIREVTRTDPPETVFDIRLRNSAVEPDVGWVSFGAERIERLV